ncbi:sensor histidine kinase [Chitinimonas naiadis]
MSDPLPQPGATPGLASSPLADPADLARHLHDGLAQLLTFALIQLDAAQDPNCPTREAAILHSRQLVKEGLLTIRNTVSQLRTAPAAGSQDLVKQLQVIGAEIRQLGSIQLVLDCPGMPIWIPENAAYRLGRAARELLINACKHAVGATVWLTLHATESDGGGLLLTVSDDGPGFDANRILQANAQGYGLSGLCAFLAPIGAQFFLRSEPGTGVWAQVRWYPNAPTATSSALQPLTCSSEAS